MALNLGPLNVPINLKGISKFEANAAKASESIVDVARASDKAAGALSSVTVEAKQTTQETKQLDKAVKDTTVDLKRAANAATKTSGSLDGVSKSSKNTGKNINNLASAARGLAAAYVSLEGAQKALQLASSTAAFEDAAKIFRQAGGNLEELRKSVNGTVSDFELVKKANLARIMGIPSDAMGTLAQAAIAASKATGESVDFMLDSIVRGVARGSPLILDNLGIIISIEEASATYAATLGKNADALTKAEKAQAVLNATLKAVGPQIEAANLAGANGAQIYGQFAASVDNLKTAMGAGLAPVVRNLIPLLKTAADFYTKLFETPTTKIAKQFEKELISNAARQQELQRMLVAGGVQTAYPVGHPLAGMGGVGPLTPGAEPLSQAEVMRRGGTRARMISAEERLRIEREISRLESRRLEILDAEKIRAAMAKRAERLAKQEADHAKSLLESRTKIKQVQVVTPTVAGADIAPLMRGPDMSLDEFNDFMDSFGFASEIVIEHNQVLEKATEAALDSAQGFQQTASVIGSILQAARSGTLFGTVGGMAGGAAGSAISMAVGDPTGMIGGTIGGVIGEFFGSIADSISGALPALIVTLIVGSVLSVLTLLFAQVLIPLVAPLAVLAGVATLAATQLWDLASQTEAMAEGERILAAAHGLLVEAIDPVVRAFLPLAVVIYEVTAPLAATFGVLLYNLGLFADVAELLFGAFKLLGTAALSIAEFLAVGDAEEQARLRAAREELLDLTYSEAQARAASILASVDATEAVREFSEELRNVPVGVKRLRALQFTATAGRFNSPAWGA